MGVFPSKPSQTLPYISVALLAVLIFLFGENATQLAEFNRSAIAENQWWRLLSAQFAHTNLFHLLVNLVGLALLWALHGDYVKPLTFVLLFIVVSFAVSLGVLFFSLHLHTYVGLSGVLHGILAWGAIHDIKQGRKTGYILVIGLAIKLIDEQFFADQHFMSQLIQSSVAIDAHLYGALAGIILACIIPASLINTDKSAVN